MIPQWAESYIGIPFEDSDKDTRNGTNCWGLTRLIYREQLGIYLPSLIANYGTSLNPRAIHSEVEKQIKESWPEIDKPLPFDILVVRYIKDASHIGVVIDNRYFLHTFEGNSSHYDDYTSWKWKHRVVGFHRCLKRIEQIGR